MRGYKHTEKAKRKIGKAISERNQKYNPGAFKKGHKTNLGRKYPGRKWTEGHKTKIGLANSIALKGKKLPEGVKKKISDANKGKNHWNWQGGITSEDLKIRQSIEFRLWREAVFARDNWTCQKCRERGGKLHSHHTKNFAEYPELRFAIDNGITFCKKCHREFHRRFGIKNNNKNQLKEFLLN